MEIIIILYSVIIFYYLYYHFILFFVGYFVGFIRIPIHEIYHSKTLCNCSEISETGYNDKKRLRFIQEFVTCFYIYICIS